MKRPLPRIGALPPPVRTPEPLRIYVFHYKGEILTPALLIQVKKELIGKMPAKWEPPKKLVLDEGIAKKILREFPPAVRKNTTVVPYQPVEER